MKKQLILAFGLLLVGGSMFGAEGTAAERLKKARENSPTWDSGSYEITTKPVMEIPSVYSDDPYVQKALDTCNAYKGTTMYDECINRVKELFPGKVEETSAALG